MAGAERAQLNGFLDWQRATAVWKCSGLTDEQARRAVLPSKLTTIAGLLNHLRWTEHYWFGVVVDGRPDPLLAAFQEDPDVEFKQGLEIPLPELLADYEAQCQVSRDIVAARELDEVVDLPPHDSRGHASVRWVLLHMIEETARHAGHLDVVRELIDGLTGQ